MTPPTTAPRPLSGGISPETACEHSHAVKARLVAEGLHTNSTWRISPIPFRLASESLAEIQTLGTHLLLFTRALNRLYSESARGSQPRWIADYLDQGKPSDLIAFARMNRFRPEREGLPAWH